MTDMVIFGAGIAGLTAAIALSKQGLQVRVLEKQPHAQAAGAGIILDHSAQQTLQALGVCLAAGEPVSGFQIAKAKNQQVLNTQQGSLLVMHRQALHLALLAHSQNLVEFDSQWDSLEDLGDSVRWWQGHTWHSAKLAIGADGLRSRVRNQSCGRCQTRFSGQIAWRGIVVNSLAVHTPTEYWHDDRSRLGLVPMANNQLYWYYTDFRDQPTLSPQWLAIAPKLDQWLAEGNCLKHELWSLPSRCAGKHRIALIGDAGQAMTPNLGRGGCQAIADAKALASAISQNGLTAKALANYDQARRTQSNRMIWASSMVGKLATVNKFVAPLRDSLLRLA